MNYPPKAYATSDAIPVTLTLGTWAADIAAVARGLRLEFANVREAVAVTARQIARTAALMVEASEWQATLLANQPVRVAGLEGRYLVRAGHATEDGLVDIVTGILTGTDPDTRYLTPENRARVVSAALVGWASSYRGEAPETLSWRRAFGDTHVQVGRAA